MALKLFIFSSVDPTDPKIVYDWFEVGVLDYNPEDKCYLVQKVNSQGRVVDGSGKPVINGGIQPDGEEIKSKSSITKYRMAQVIQIEISNFSKGYPTHVYGRINSKFFKFNL